MEYAYGFGVYETIRVKDGKALFIDEHCRRLLESANIISLEHSLTPAEVNHSCQKLIDKNNAENCNLKLMLVGGKTAAESALYIICLNPLFPDRKLYRDGAKAITQRFERPIPQAKTLNMLQSYLAYREAKRAGAYDALAINSRNELIEGTRTNFFAIKDKTLFSPPEADILLGVTRGHVIEVAKNNGYSLQETSIKLDALEQYDGFFLTSTSSKIMPLSKIDNRSFKIPKTLTQLMKLFDAYLADL